MKKGKQDKIIYAPNHTVVNKTTLACIAVFCCYAVVVVAMSGQGQVLTLSSEEPYWVVKIEKRRATCGSEWVLVSSEQRTARMIPRLEYKSSDESHPVSVAYINLKLLA